MTPADIIREVESALELPDGAVTGPRRFYAYTDGRFLAAWLMRKGLGLSYLNIAVSIGRTDHASAIYAVNEANKRGRVSPALNNHAQRIMQMIAGS